LAGKFADPRGCACGRLEQSLHLLIALARSVAKGIEVPRMELTSQTAIARAGSPRCRLSVGITCSIAVMSSGGTGSLVTAKYTRHFASARQKATKDGESAQEVRDKLTVTLKGAARTGRNRPNVSERLRSPVANGRRRTGIHSAASWPQSGLHGYGGADYPSLRRGYRPLRRPSGSEGDELILIPSTSKISNEATNTTLVTRTILRAALKRVPLNLSERPRLKGVFAVDNTPPKSRSSLSSISAIRGVRTRDCRSEAQGKTL
jgi:hypothetical protein